MSTYLRRMVVPEADAVKVVADIHSTLKLGPEQIMTKVIYINHKQYRIIQFVSNKPYMYSKGLTLTRNGGLTQTKILQKIYATDLDLGAAIVIDATDYGNADETTADDYTITVDITDPDGITNTLEFALAVVDATLAVITAEDQDVNTEDVDVGDVGWLPVASAVDDGDAITNANLTFAYYEEDTHETAYASKAAAMAALYAGTTVYATVDYQDAAGNDAVQVAIVLTPVDNTAPVITLTNGDETIANADATSWDHAFTATDNVDGDIAANITDGSGIAYYESDGTTPLGTQTLAAFRTHLENSGTGAVGVVKYDVDDAAGNSATQKTATITCNAA